MNVKELIDFLEKIEDKEKSVAFEVVDFNARGHGYKSTVDYAVEEEDQVKLF